MLIFDIETGGLPLDHLQSICPPFEPPAHPGIFDESAVKYGNTKAPDKRAAILEAARQKHAAAVASYEIDVETARRDHFDNFVQHAALDPTTGQVLAIGYLSVKPEGGQAVLTDLVGGNGEDDGERCEIHLLEDFWEQYRTKGSKGRHFVGCNSHGFDLPFLIRRSWILGVAVPATVRRGRYFDSIFIDIREQWLCGQPWGNCQSSLGHIAQALGCGEKNGDGEHFAELLAIDRDAARAYLVNDLELTAACAVRMGIV